MKVIFTLKENLRKHRLLLLKPVLSVCILMLVKTQAIAQSVNLVIDPVAVQVNDVFAVPVKVDFGTGSLALVETYINFNPLDLEIVSIPTVPAGTQSAFPNESVAFGTVAAMNAAGELDYGRFTFSAIGSHITTDFVFFTVTFRALRVPPGGTTTLSFNSTPPRVTNTAEFGTPDALDESNPATITISAAGCGTPPTATLGVQAGPATCDANTFNLVLATVANGTGPFDLNITSPSGTATFNNIAVGGTITNFTPPSTSVWPAVPFPLPSTFTDNSYTLGVKFSTSVTGFVKGVRFLSADAVSPVPGNYTGQLWTNTGTLLANGTFAGVTSDSWQQILFPEPILIAAGTTYIASYNIGVSTDYASTPNGLVAPQTNGPVTALANGGVFTQGSPVAFPATSTDNNYWADVIFAPNNYSFVLNSVIDDAGCVNNPGTPINTLNVQSIDCSTLPVSLINFSATPKDNAVLLRWSTASELNNLGFELQRSIDGNNGWSAIAFVNGAGNSNSVINYSYVDENLTASRYYYRLKQIDIDQRFAYSPIVSVQLDGKQAFDLQQNYPNPFRGETIIRFTLPYKTTVSLSIFDMNGRLVKVLANGSKDSGTHAVTLQSGILTSGLYYYKLQAGDFSAVKKLTIR